MARPELGVKRQCMSCGAKFYDLNKDPIICPKCAAVFQAAGPARVAAPVAARQRQEEEVEVEPAGPEMVSLDEVEATESGKDAVIDDDIEVADDVGTEDDTFLEEEEEGTDDVSGLIDGDIEEDDEP